MLDKVIELEKRILARTQTMFIKPIQVSSRHDVRSTHVIDVSGLDVESAVGYIVCYVDKYLSIQKPVTIIMFNSDTIEKVNDITRILDTVHPSILYLYNHTIVPHSPVEKEKSLV